MKPLFLILVVAMAVPAGASARQIDPGTHSYTPGSSLSNPGAHWYTPEGSLSDQGTHSYTPGSSLSDASDAARVALVRARGTDVAAPDQQAPPTPPTASTTAGFDWGAAGIGAIAGIALLIAMLAAVGLRRRHSQPRTVATT
jgi:hypothetical protein